MSTAVVRVAEPASPRSGRWPATVWALLAGTFITRAGGFTYPYLAYHLADRGVGASWASIVLALFGAGWLVGQVTFGSLADRIGRRATLVTAMTAAAVVFPLLAGAHALGALAAAAFVAGVVYDAPRPIVSAVIADTIPDEPTRAKVAGWRHFAVNLGAACTGAIGGMLAEPVGIPVLFCINAAVCAVFAVVARRVLPPTRSKGLVPQGSYRAALTDARLLFLWLASVCALIPVAALYSVLPLMMADDHLPTSAYGWSQVAGAIAVLVLSPLMNPWLARRAAGPAPMVGLLAASALLLGAGMGSAGLTSSPVGYAAAVVIAVPGEIAAFICAADVVNRIAPAHSRGLYAGIWGTTLAVAALCAPLLAGWSLAEGGHLLVAISLTGCGVLGAAACLPLAVLTHRLREPTRPGA